jgi:EmrB/QacA subfamily drug resistance transporter
LPAGGAAQPPRHLAKREVIFVAIMLAIFMVSIEATIVATALPTIVGALGGLRFFSWVFGAYLLTQAISIPIYGRLADFFGRKPMLISAIAIFLIGSTLSGFAHSMPALILFRALQGIGAGGVQPVATTIVGDLYSGQERARVQGILSSLWAFAAVAGPLLGAFIVQHVGWPVIFWINVPIGIACVGVFTRVYSEKLVPVAHSIDYAGSALLAVGIGTLMFVLVNAGNMATILAVPLATFAIGVLAVLLVHQTRTREPMMPLFLYRIRVIRVANFGNFCIGAMIMGVSAFMPTYVQGAMGQSAVVAGLVLGSMFIGWTPGSIIGAQLQLHTSYRFTAICGAVSVLAGAALLVTLRSDSLIAHAAAGVIALGLGFGLINSVFVVATQTAVGWDRRGAATSSNIFLRQIGQAIGSAVFGAIFNIGIYASIPDAGNAVTALMDPLKRALVAPLDLARNTNAIATSLHQVYVILCVLAVIEFGLVLTLPAKARPPHAKPIETAQGVSPA